MTSEQERLQKEIAELQTYRAARAKAEKTIEINQERLKLMSRTDLTVSYGFGESHRQELRDNIAKAEQRVADIDKDLQTKYQMTQDPRARYDTITGQLDKAIAEREKQVPERSKVPSMAERKAAKLAAQAEAQQQATEPAQPSPPAVPPTPVNPKASSQPSHPVAAPPPPSQDTPTPQPAGETKPTSQASAQAPTHHEREGGPYRDMSGYRLPDGPEGNGGSSGRTPPPAAPTPGHPPGEPKDTRPPSTPTPGAPTGTPPPAPLSGWQALRQEAARGRAETTRGRAENRAAWQELRQAAGLDRQTAPLSEIDQGIKQMNADITREQGQRGPWKKPLRDLYEPGSDHPEPPSPQGPERDHDR